MTVPSPKNTQNNEKIKETVDDLVKQIKTQVDQWQVPKEHEKYLETDFENKDDYSTKTKRISDSINYQSLIKELEEHLTKLDKFQDLYDAIDHNRIETSKKILKSPRKLLHREIMDWLLFPLIQKQTYFNVETINTIKTLLNEIALTGYQNSELQSKQTSMNSEIEILVEEIDNLDAEHQKIKFEIDKTDLRDKLRIYFKAYLEKNPNQKELEWHVNAIQQGKMKLEEIPQHFKSLPEYKGIQLLKHGCIYTIFGTKMYLNKHDNDHSRALAVHHFWEIDEAKILQNYIKNGMNVVDIGANIGYYTILFSKWVGPQGKVFSFEPDPKNFKLILKNISANQCKNVKAEQKAVSNTCNLGTLYQSIENPGAHRILDFYAYKNDDHRKKIDMELVTLDTYFDAKNKIDLIKMDIEGAEMMALKGMKETIENNKKMMIFTEFWPYGIEKSGHSPKDFIEQLNQFEFQIFTLKEGKKEKITHDFPLINNYDLYSQDKLFCEKN